MWGMGTSVEKAISVSRLAEDQAPSYNMKGYTFDGMDFFNCYAGFKHVFNETLKTSRPALIEVITERFRGHSISDPGLYRSKESLKECMQRDPILLMQQVLMKENMLNDERYKEMEKKERDLSVAAMKFAEESPWPDLGTLEKDVFAP
jgi:pyruvate dehydrogenase E1 component alpha subunit